MGEVTRQVSIKDIQGKSILNVSCQFAGDSRGPQRKFVLRSAIDSSIFGICADTLSEPGISIFNHDEQFFGSLTLNGSDSSSGFTLRTREGLQVSIEYDAQAGKITAMDQQGRLLARAEASNPSIWEAHIGPRVDAGLVTLVIAASDLLHFDTCSR